MGEGWVYKGPKLSFWRKLETEDFAKKNSLKLFLSTKQQTNRLWSTCHHTYLNYQHAFHARNARSDPTRLDPPNPLNMGHRSDPVIPIQPINLTQVVLYNLSYRWSLALLYPSDPPIQPILPLDPNRCTLIRSRKKKKKMLLKYHTSADLHTPP